MIEKEVTALAANVLANRPLESLSEDEKVMVALLTRAGYLKRPTEALQKCAGARTRKGIKEHQ
jgi:hypothetical protein